MEKQRNRFKLVTRLALWVTIFAATGTAEAQLLS
jgi:hypothetical protein